MNKRLFVGLLFAFSLIATPAYSEPASPESIRKLMESTGAGEVGVQVINQMLPAMKQLVPNAPEEFWQDFMAEINADEMIDLVIPIYQKYLTEEDIQAINAFYNTPEGKKLIRVQPLIIQESMQVGQQWGEEIARKVIKRYEEEYGQ